MSTTDISISTRGTDKVCCTLAQPSATLIKDLKMSLAQKYARECRIKSLDRIRLTSGGLPVDDEKALSFYHDKNRKLNLEIKDLGLQVSYRLVFIFEYLGPLLAFPLVALLRPLPAYRSSIVSAAIAFMIHFAKRELETIFVHKFSHATMPIKNLIRNCFYYFMFAFWIALSICHPKYSPPSGSHVRIGYMIFFFAEAMNGLVHLKLSRMRSVEGSSEKGLPAGPLFFVACPNYFFEVLAWLGFNIATQSLAGIAFMIGGFYQMAVWALEKHRKYRKLFDGKEGRQLYTQRYSMIPFLL